VVTNRDVDAIGLRPFMSGFPTGVGVVTALDEHAEIRGTTCSSLCSVTLEPPTVLVCLRLGSRTLDAARSSGRFALNLLHGRAEEIATRFAAPGSHRFDGVRWVQDPAAAGPHLIDAAQSTADCDLTYFHLVGSHAVVYGRVRRITEYTSPRPLLYGLRRFADWAESLTAAG
jgi:flavin reductase (DIM6/NTAB) family NADH-FMN oxidoreductase RutF